MFRHLWLVLASLGLLAVGACGADGTTPRALSTASPLAAPAPQSLGPRAASVDVPGMHHYEYVATDGTVYVYDMDSGGNLAQRIPLPGVHGVRGLVASPSTARLYISFGGDKGPGSRGSLLAYDLLAGKVVWTRTYDRGIDSPAIDPRGRIIYMPDGELSHDGIWTVLDAGNGNVLGEIRGGLGPHNTLVGPSGRYVYLGARNSPYLDVVSTRTRRVVRRVGPLVSGVRPFTVDGRERFAFTTATGFLGFQVSSLVTGRVLYTVGFGRRFRYDPATFAPSAPSHGISLSPDQRQLWVLDAPNNYVHVYAVGRIARSRPRKLADIRLVDRLSGDESQCSYDCARDGWLQHSTDGCLVFVGDSGEVLSRKTLRAVEFLPELRNSRKHLEVDWQNGAPVATTSRLGVGQVSGTRLPPPPKCTR